MTGYLDGPSGLELVGWAWDPAQPDVRVRLHIAIDGVFWRSCTAFNFRPDLQQAGFGDGKCAFSVQLPLRVFDGEDHVVSATIEGGAHLDGSPKVFRSCYRGLLASIGNGRITGRLTDEARPSTPVVAEVYGDDRYLGWALTGEGGSFEIRLPAGFDSGRISKFDLFPRGVKTPAATETRGRSRKFPAFRMPRLRTVNFAAAVGVPLTEFRGRYEIDIRDYSWICPRVDLIDETGRYCGEPTNPAGCERCFRKLGPRADWGSLLHQAGSVAEMRQQYRQVLEQAELIRFPSQDAADRIRRYAPGIRKVEIQRWSTLAVSTSTGSSPLGATAVTFTGDTPSMQFVDPGLAALPEILALATNKLLGGVARHVQEQAARLREAGKKVFLIRYTATEASVDADGGSDAVTVPIAALRQKLMDLGVRKLHIHQIVDAPVEIFQLGIPYDITVHDYGWICPQVTLQDRTGEYCGEPVDVAACEECYRTLGRHKDWGSMPYGTVGEMRSANVQILESAEAVYFPSMDAAKRMSRYAPGMRNVVVAPPPPQGSGPPYKRRWVRSATADHILRVAYIGSLGYAKGFHGMYALALDCLKRGLPAKYYVIGATPDPRLLMELGVEVFGQYDEGEVHELIDQVAPHVAIFPGVLPETYSYTLSIAFEAGVWPVAYDLGAIAERIREAGFGTLIPLGASASHINDTMLALG